MEKNKYERYSLSSKEIYKDKDGNEKTKWHNCGILFKDEKGQMFGSLNIFGSKIKFSAFPEKKDSNNKGNYLPKAEKINTEDIPDEDTPF